MAGRTSSVLKSTMGSNGVSCSAKANFADVRASGDTTPGDELQNIFFRTRHADVQCWDKLFNSSTNACITVGYKHKGGGWKEWHASYSYKETT